MNGSEVIEARGPSGRIHRVGLTPGVERITCDRARDITGQWTLRRPGKPARGLLILHNAVPVDEFGQAYMFSVRLDDVGEDFILIAHADGLTILVLQFSPSKCPLSTYHSFLSELVDLDSPPLVGRRSVGGRDSERGRQPNADELIHDVSNAALTVLRFAHSIRSELSEHDRTEGGESGLDARRTIDAWKANPSWYSLQGESSPATVQIGAYDVLPIRAKRRIAQGSNLYLAAAASAINELAASISPLGGALVARHLLEQSVRRMASYEPCSNLDAKVAWSHLEQVRHPPRSAALARHLLTLRDFLRAPPLRLPASMADTPYFLPPPELVFQRFATVLLLLALGSPRDQIPVSMTVLARGKPIVVRDYTIWTDASNPPVTGWRDGLSIPSGYRPDIVICKKADKTTLLVDAKFRRRGQGKGEIMAPSGIKDMQAYMEEFDHSQAIILAPSIDDTTHCEDLEDDKHHIRGIALPPSGERDHVMTMRDALRPFFGRKGSKGDEC